MADRRAQILARPVKCRQSAASYSKGCRCDDCKRAAAAYRLDYRLKNLEAMRARGRADYHRHVDDRRAATRRYAAQHRERILLEKRQETRRRRALIDRYKALVGCRVCRSTFVPLLQFHHRDPAQKTFEVSRGIARSWPLVKAEIRKCDVVCRLCHVDLHRADS